MGAKWVPVPKYVAKQHKLYGVWGWLLAFVIGTVIGWFLNFGQMADVAGKAGLTLGEFLSMEHPVASYFKGLIWLVSAHTAIVVVMAAMKARNFRTVVFWLLVGMGPAIWILALANEGINAGEVIIGTIFAWLLTCAVWGTYLQRSRRVRVTFEHMVRATEVPESGEPQPRQEPEVNFAPEPQVAAVPQKNITAAVPSAHVPSVVSGPSSNEAAWAQALEEFEGNDRRRGLWAKSFAEANGDETRAKVLYLKARAHEIDQAERVATAERVARESRPMGTCPNSSCWAVIPMDSSECPHCGEKFDGDSHPLLRA